MYVTEDEFGGKIFSTQKENLKLEMSLLSFKKITKVTFLKYNVISGTRVGGTFTTNESAEIENRERTILYIRIEKNNKVSHFIIFNVMVYKIKTKDDSFIYSFEGCNSEEVFM